MADRDPHICLGHLTERAEEYVSRGDFETIDEVVVEAFNALDRQHRGETEQYIELVREAISNPDRFLPMEEAFAELDERKRIRRGE